MDAETALTYEPHFEEEVDDGLGYYDDGVKRTLTDEQIEMFRHTEVEQLIREGRMQRVGGQSSNGDHELEKEQTKGARRVEGSPSPSLSNENEAATTLTPASIVPPSQHAERRRSQSTNSGLLSSTDPKFRLRREEVPYDERHKRKWEAYIEENDSIQGSLTHRRIVRELDEQKDESVDLDY